MKQLRKILLITLGVGLVGIVISLITETPSKATNNNIVPVSVTNTPLPVTVTGSPSVSVSNFPSAQNVSVSNTSSTPIRVTDVDNPAHNAVFGTCGTSGASLSAPCSFNVGSQLTSISTVHTGYE